MIFKSCTVDTRSGNVLASPGFTLLSDQELTFTMASVPSVPSNQYSTVNVYKTSILGHPSTLLRSHSAYSSTWDIFPEETITRHNICLPAGTYRLVFIALEPENVIQSTAALTEVLLTNSSCTYTSLAGNQLTFKMQSCDNDECRWWILLVEIELESHMQKSKIAEAAILKSVIRQKFCHLWTDSHQIWHRDRNWGPGSCFTSKIDMSENHRWWQCHTEIQIVSHNWAIIAYCSIALYATKMPFKIIKQQIFM